MVDPIELEMTKKHGMQQEQEGCTSLTWKGAAEAKTLHSNGIPAVADTQAGPIAPAALDTGPETGSRTLSSAVEHHVDIVGVTGSIPVASTIPLDPSQNPFSFLDTPEGKRFAEEADAQAAQWRAEQAFVNLMIQRLYEVQPFHQCPDADDLYEIAELALRLAYTCYKQEGKGPVRGYGIKNKFVHAVRTHKLEEPMPSEPQWFDPCSTAIYSRPRKSWAEGGWWEEIPVRVIRTARKRVLVEFDGKERWVANEKLRPVSNG